MGDFQKLKVWQRAKNLSVFIYAETGKGTFNKDYSFKDQMRRAAVSIASNIAEGDELDTDKQSIKFFLYRQGIVCRSSDSSYNCLGNRILKERRLFQIEKECKAISAMLTKLIRARSGF